MSTTSEISISPLPITSDTALNLLIWMFATSGIPTDYNQGSIIRTYSEAVGSVCEIEGVEATAQAFQALVYSAFSAFGISPLGAQSAVGVVTFSTLSSTPLPSGQSIIIPNNSVVQTVNGVQFITTASATLVSGTTSVNSNIVAVNPGPTGNVPAGAITQIATGLAYPLAVLNAAPTAGGKSAETIQQTLNRFLAVANSIGLCTPTAISSAVIGVTFGTETVQYSSLVEPWIIQVQMGNPNPTSGWDLYIDNGSGAASSGLINATITFLSSGAPAGYRDAGVPFFVYAVTPIYYSVVITATAINPLYDVTLQTAMTQAVQSYAATIEFTSPVEITQITAAVANASFGQLTSLSVGLFDSFGSPQTSITCTYGQRMILQSLAVTVM